MASLEVCFRIRSSVEQSCLPRLRYNTEIEQINFLPPKKAAFVNLCVDLPYLARGSSPESSPLTLIMFSCTVSNATKAIERIRANPEYNNFKISYGKDRCANPPKLQYVFRCIQDHYRRSDH